MIDLSCKSFKRIDETTIGRIKNIKPDVLAAHGAIKRVHNKANEFVCQFCGNGEGDDATGIKPLIADNHVGYKCQRCGAKFDNISILAEYYKLNVQQDFNEICRRACDEFNISLYTETPAQAVKHKPQPTADEKKEREERLKKINAVITDAQKNLPDFIQSQGGAWRGLTGRTLSHFGCGYLPDWHHSKKCSTSPRVIIPAETAQSSANYLARLTIPIDSISADERKWIPEKEHDGEKTLFNRDATIGAKSLVVVEGYIDAMSIFQAFEEKIKVVALGGKNGGGLLLNVLKTLNQKPETLILFDADATDTAENLRGELVKIGVPAVNRIFDDVMTDTDKQAVGGKIDANSILVALGAGKLKSYTESILTAAQVDFKAVEEKIAREAALMKRLDEWQKQNGKINPKLLPEIKDAAEYVEGLNADDFDVADVYDLIRNQQIALLSYYLPQHRQQFFDVLTDAVKFARKAIKELEKQKPPAEPDARLKKLAKITVGEIKKAVDELKGDVKNKHRTYLIELEAKAIQEEREREIANFKPEQTKQKISDCPVDLKLPRGVYFDDKGIRRVDWDKPPNKYGGRPVINVCTTPIVPTKILREPSKNTTAYEVAIKARGFWRSVEIDGDELADSKKIIRLAKDGGALIESAQHLCKYFAQIIGANQNVLPEIKCYNKTGWHSDDFSSFVYPADDADYIVRRAGFDFKKSLAVRGDAEKWKKAFVIACGDKSGISDSVARIFFGYGALAPLVRPLNLQNAQLLLHCKSNNGKSALQKLTASFYGNPRELIKSFSATLKYRQGVATAYCDLPTFLDEPEAGANKRNEENYSQMIYDYAEGKTNQANQKNGAARESENFYGTRVITAERPLLKPSDKNGAYKRMPQITCEKLFSLDFAVYLHETTEENYGHFGKAWTEYITAHRKEIAASYRHIKELIKKRDLNVEKTVRNAIIAAAVATQYVFVMLNFKLQFDADEAEADAAAILASLPSQDEQDEATRALDALRSHFAAKEKSFVHEGNNKNADEAFTNADNGGDVPTPTFDISGKILRNREVAILPTVLRRWLEKDLGFANMDALITEWTRRGLLRCGKGRNLITTRINGKPTWTIRFKAGVLFDTEEEETSFDD